MKLTFLGVSGMLSDGFNSNVLLDIKDRTFLIDCGIDVKYSLKAANRKVEEIDDVYISHLHSDHCGSIEWLAFYTYFITKKKIKLHIHESLYSDLWNMLRPSLENHKGKFLTLHDYFDVNVFERENGRFFYFDGFLFVVRKNLHVKGLYSNMYSFSLAVKDCTKPYSATGEEFLFYISSDVVNVPLRVDAKYVFHDCDVMNLDGVHVNYNNLKEIDKNSKSKIWLYHYADLGKEMPDAVADGFAGFVKEGQVFEF